MEIEIKDIGDLKSILKKELKKNASYVSQEMRRFCLSRTFSYPPEVGRHYQSFDRGGVRLCFRQEMTTPTTMVCFFLFAFPSPPGVSIKGLQLLQEYMRKYNITHTSTGYRHSNFYVMSTHQADNIDILALLREGATEYIELADYQGRIHSCKLKF